MITRFLLIDVSTIWIGIHGWRWWGISKEAPYFRTWQPTREV